jgi:tubby-related protein 1
LLFAKKQAGNRTSNYRIFTSKEDTNFVAKLRSNFFGTDYNLYDNGDNPKKNKKTNRPRKRLA